MESSILIVNHLDFSSLLKLKRKCSNKHFSNYFSLSVCLQLSLKEMTKWKKNKQTNTHVSLSERFFKEIFFISVNLYSVMGERKQTPETILHREILKIGEVLNFNFCKEEKIKNMDKQIIYMYILYTKYILYYFFMIISIYMFCSFNVQCPFRRWAS